MAKKSLWNFALIAMLALLAKPVMQRAYGAPTPKSPVIQGERSANTGAKQNQIDPEAEVLLKKVKAHLQGTGFLTAVVTTDTQFKPRGTQKIGLRVRTVNHVMLAKPHLRRMEVMMGPPSRQNPAEFDLHRALTLVTDGKTEWTYSEERKVYDVQPFAANHLEPDPDAQQNGFLGPLDGYFDSDASIWNVVQVWKREGLLRMLRITGTEDWNGTHYQLLELIHAGLPEAGGKSLLYTYLFYIGPDAFIHRLTEQSTNSSTYEVRVDALKTGSTPTDLTPFVFVPPADAKPSPTSKSLLRPGTPAPGFTVMGPDGKPIHLADYRHKIVVLDFWATWCGPCRAALPDLARIYRQGKQQGVIVLGICLWDDRASYRHWWSSERGRTLFPTAFDPAGKARNKSTLSERYRVQVLPTTYLLSREGKVVVGTIGYDEKAAVITTALRALGVRVTAVETRPAPNEAR